LYTGTPKRASEAGSIHLRRWVFASGRRIAAAIHAQKSAVCCRGILCVAVRRASANTDNRVNTDIQLTAYLRDCSPWNQSSCFVCARPQILLCRALRLATLTNRRKTYSDTLRLKSCVELFMRCRRASASSNLWVDTRLALQYAM